MPEHHLTVEDLCARWRPGSYDPPWDWDDEHRDLWPAPETQQLRAAIETDGIAEPVLLGDDGRVWDGHHRIVIARALGLERIPVTLTGPTPPTDPPPSVTSKEDTTHDHHHCRRNQDL